MLLVVRQRESDGFGLLEVKCLDQRRVQEAVLEAQIRALLQKLHGYLLALVRVAAEVPHHDVHRRVAIMVDGVYGLIIEFVQDFEAGFEVSVVQRNMQGRAVCNWMEPQAELRTTQQ